ncbi:MAG: TIGR03086 family protein [Chloroflexi bacterium]|nr:TIGR03086 family protein [Chloroflexota bacterium]
MSDDVELLHRTTELIASVLSGVGREVYDDPTPCSEWTVRDVINHIVAGARRFAGWASGEPSSATPAGQAPDVVGDEPYDAYVDASKEMVEAWRRRGLEGEVAFGPLGLAPARSVCRVAMVDHLVHGWDIAQSVGRSFTADDELIDVSWEFAHANMTPERRGAGKPFADAVEPPQGATRLDQLMAFMGRRPMTAR